MIKVSVQTQVVVGHCDFKVVCFSVLPLYVLDVQHDSSSVHQGIQPLSSFQKLGHEVGDGRGRGDVALNGGERGRIYSEIVKAIEEIAEERGHIVNVEKYEYPGMFYWTGDILRDSLREKWEIEVSQLRRVAMRYRRRDMGYIDIINNRRGDMFKISIHR